MMYGGKNYGSAKTRIRVLPFFCLPPAENTKKFF
jgi:hypothetical protein